MSLSIFSIAWNLGGINAFDVEKGKRGRRPAANSAHATPRTKQSSQMLAEGTAEDLNFAVRKCLVALSQCLGSHYDVCNLGKESAFTPECYSRVYMYM